MKFLCIFCPWTHTYILCTTSWPRGFFYVGSLNFNPLFCFRCNSWKVCKISTYRSYDLLIWSETITCQKILKRGKEISRTQIWGIGWLFQKFVIQILQFVHYQHTIKGWCVVLMEEVYFLSSVLCHGFLHLASQEQKLLVHIGSNPK